MLLCAFTHVVRIDGLCVHTCIYTRRHNLSFTHVVRIDGLCVHTCIYTHVHNLFYFVLLGFRVIFQTVLKFIV